MAEEARSSNSLKRTLLRRVGKAIADYSMIVEGDRIAVGLSGGKDSFGMLDLLLKLKARAPVSFDITAVTVHNGSPDFRSDIIVDYDDFRIVFGYFTVYRQNENVNDRSIHTGSAG